MSSHKALRVPAITVAAIHVVTMVVPIAAFADTPPGVSAANGNTQVYLAPNGVPVVNIANPNGAGLSHNQYTQYNVDARGLVLNNGTVAELTRQSQLAGQTLANVNLDRAASVILNEVVSPNRSVLAGFTEVLGGRADVVVANPFGITCNGCGFINTDRVSLTTGAPNIGAAGALHGFSVNGGDVLISGAGLDGTNQSYFDIVTRSLKVDGQLNAHTLNVITGANDWTYATGSATAISGAAPFAGYAFDSTALGGVYADRIRIIATEAGVGVRTLGEVAATGDDFSIDAAGRIELHSAITAIRNLNLNASGAGITLADGALALGSNLSLTATSVENHGELLAGNALTLNAGDVLNTGIIQAASGAAITADSLRNSGAAARILTSASGAGAGTISIADALVNEGAIHGNDDLSLTAGSVHNTGTGGISSSTLLAVTSATGGIENEGALYGADRLDLRAAGQTFTNSVSGTVDAGDLLIEAGTFTNRNSVIADGTATIRTTTAFNNLSGHSRDSIVGLAAMSEEWRQTGYECNGGSDLINPCGGADIGYAEYHFYSAFRTFEEGFVVDEEGFPVAATLAKPQIIAGTALSIDIGAGTGHNQTGLIAAPLLTLSGTGTFTNEDLHLDRWSEQFDWWRRFARGASSVSLNWRAIVPPGPSGVEVEIPNPTPGDVANFDSHPYPWYETARQTLPVAANLSAGLFADTLDFGGITLNNVGSTSAAANLGSPASYLTPASPSGALPTNPNGRFVESRDSQSRYLIETNPLYGEDGSFGSDYLARLLGYNVDTLEKRLGDGNYEAKLVREQLISQTGRNILAGYASEKDQMVAMMDAGAAQSKELGLEFGKALTSEQLGNLKHDMVWMVEREVRGEKVLVPVVYLASSTRQQIETGAVIRATNISFDGQSLQNVGGVIRADENLSLTATGDIVNRSGSIAGGDVALTSKEGNIRNETVTRTVEGADATNTMVGETGSITATGDLALDAGKNVVVQGASVSAGGDATIRAGENVSIDTVQNRTRDTTRAYESSFGSTKSTKTTTETVQQLGSEVKAGGSVAISSGQDVTVGGSAVSAGGDVAIDAGRDLNIVERKDEHSVLTVTKSTSITASETSIGSEREKETNLKSTTTNVGSTITAGGNAALESGNTLTVKGSDVAAGGNLDVTAKDINVLAGENTTVDATHTERDTLSIGVHGDSDSYGWGLTGEQFTGEKVDTTSEARASTLRSGGNMSRSASDTITDVGTQIEAGGDFSQNATTIDSRAAADTQTSTSSSRTDTMSVGFSVNYGVGNAIEDAEKGNTAGTVEASGGPTSGVNFDYKQKTESADSSSSQAVTSSIKAGGKITSTSTKDTTLEGTQLESGGDMTIGAQNLNAKAAEDTERSSSSSQSIEGGLRVEIDASKKPGGKLSGGYGNADAESQSSDAVVGSMKSGGDINVRTTGDTTLEGTRIESKGDTTLDAGGNVKLDAARNNAASSASNLEVSGSVSVSKGGGGASGDLSMGASGAQSTEAVTGSVAAGGDLTIRSGKDVTVEGADLSAGQDATISADRKVEMREAVSASESESVSLEASVAVSVGGVGPPVLAGGGASASAEKTSTETKKNATIEAGGAVTVESKDSTDLHDTEVKSGEPKP